MDLLNMLIILLYIAFGIILAKVSYCVVSSFSFLKINKFLSRLKEFKN